MNPQYAAWPLRLALSASFLSAVADRLGLWGPPGAPSVAWGDWAHFRAYSEQLNAWLPTWSQAALAYTATGAEVLLGIALLVSPRRALAAVAVLSCALLCAFALSMSFAIGPKAPLDYSVWVSAAAAWLLASISQRRAAA